VNAADEWLTRMSSRLSDRTTYAVGQAADYTFDAVQLNPKIQLTYQKTNISSHLFGNYNADNIAAACAIALKFGVPEEKLAPAVASYVPSNHRSQILERDGNIYYIDCYNANPSSMELAIRNFMSMTAQDKSKVLMLGDMFEMGAHEAAEHEQLMQFIATVKPDSLYICGQAFGKQQHIYPCQWFETSNDLLTYLKAHPISQSVVLLKGSRGMKMENILT
jgi:UDP-N-acetylmuramoyl-tripeptide--D-alanyl-D-alanine ligase